MSSPVPNLETYIAQHLAQDEVLKRFAASSRGSPLVSDALLARLRDDAAKLLFATNARSRIAIARATLEEVATIVGKGKLPPAFFVTLASKRFAVPIEEAADFDVARLIEWTSWWLGTLNHLTIVEVALYTTVSGWPGGVVSWHTHSLVWGCSEWMLQAIIDGFNDREEALVRGRQPAHSRRLASESTVRSRSLYMLKAPMRDHRVYPLVEELVDHLTGEIIKGETGLDKQQKRPMLERPGDLVKIYDVLGNRHIPSLLFGGGKGIALRDRIVARALAYVTPSLGQEPMIMPGGAKVLFG